MTITTVLAYLLIVCFFVMERSLRKGKPALSLKPGAADAGSSQLLWISGVIGLLLTIAAPILNAYQIGYWHSAANSSVNGAALLHQYKTASTILASPRFESRFPISRHSYPA
jgi:hypothetical protein